MYNFFFNFALIHKIHLCHFGSLDGVDDGDVH